MGYVGPVLEKHLRTVLPDACLIGYDTAFFAHCVTSRTFLPERVLDAQQFGDIRDITADDLRGFDAVVQLAAISNDPMGNRFEAVTEEINQHASVALAHAAAAAGVRNFVFASSCSVYGFAGDGIARREGDAVNPLTAYARSKTGTEEALRQADLGGMTTTSLRFSTACGYSDRLRLDLVLNDFVACALSTGEISVLSDGTPWRPLIEVRDMARAIEWAITRPAECGGAFLTVNVGKQAWNYRVKDIAHAVAREIPGTRVSINENAQPDTRSYKVDFSLYREIAPNHQPLQTLDSAITGLIHGLRAQEFDDPDFRQSTLIRLKVLEDHLAQKRLSRDLRWFFDPKRKDD